MNELDVIDLPTGLTGFTWRFARREDLPAVHQMLTVADTVNDTTSAGELDDLQREYDDPWCNPQTDFILGVTLAGEIAAMGRVFVNPNPAGNNMAYLLGEVHPKYRERGLGEALFGWLERRAYQRLKAFATTKSHLLRAGCPDNLRDRIDLFERHGFRPVRYFFHMRRDLNLAIPNAPQPEGIMLQMLHPELEQATLQALNDSFADHWGFEPITQADWQMFYLQAAGFRRDLTYLAMADEQIAGLILDFVKTEQNERLGVKEGWIQDLGIHPAWRDKDIATPLLCQAMRAFKNEGLDYAALGVDTDSPTGILEVYEKLGFVAVKRYVTFEKTTPRM